MSNSPIRPGMQITKMKLVFLICFVHLAGEHHNLYLCIFHFFSLCRLSCGAMTCVIANRACIQSLAFSCSAWSGKVYLCFIINTVMTTYAMAS